MSYFLKNGYFKILLILSFGILNFSILVSQNNHDLNWDKSLSASPQFLKNQGQWNDSSLFQFSSGRFKAIFFKDRIQFATARLKFPETESTRVRQKPGEQKPYDPAVIVQVWEIIYNNAGSYEYKATGKKESIIGFLNQNTNGKILYPDAFGELTLKNLYPGVDAEFKTDVNGGLKIDYRLQHAHNLNQITFSIVGFDKTYLNSQGSICMQSNYGTIADSIPGSFIGEQFTQNAVVKYKQIGENSFGFELQNRADTDETEPLLVDPFYLDYSTYFYGNLVSGWTYVYDVEVDENNNSYVTGYTTDKYPGTPGTYDTTLNGSADGFLGKIPSSGGKPIYVIYLGGSNTEYSYSVAATNKGDCFVTGYSYSSDYPTTNGVIEATRPSSTSYTSFVTGVKSDGKTLIYSTYLKGYNWVIDVNETGQVYIAPYGDNPYPITRNINPPGQVGGGLEANVIRLNAAGSAILDCVELIGSGTEYVYGLSVDKKNQVYAAGWTNSDNLPVTYGQKNFGGVYMGGSYDGFLFKIDSAFTKYLIAKYIGTKGYDYLSGIAVNDDEEIFIQGIAGANDLPAATNTFPGGSAAFIMRIYKNGAFPRWTTYITTNTYAWRQRLTVSAKDEAVFGGTTWSTTLPVTADAFQKTNKGGADGYAGKIGIDGSIKYLTYFGGSGTDYLFAVQAKRIGCVSHLIMGGYCGSNNFPLKNEWKSTPRGGFFWTGAVIKWRDTLKVDPIDLGPDVVNCDRNYRIIEAGNPGASYRWQNGDTFSYFIVQKPGKYWVTATYGCGSKSDTIVFKTAASAKSWMPKDSLICNRYGIWLDAQNDTIKGIRYKWNTGDTVRKILVTKSGFYKVDMFTPVCNWRYDSIYITKLYSPKQGIDLNDTLLCRPFRLTVKSGTDSIPAKYSWNVGDTLPFISTVKEGIFSVNISNRCGKLKDSVKISSDSAESIRFKTDTLLCDKDSFEIARKTSSTYTSILWDDGNKSARRVFKQSGLYWVNISNTCTAYRDSVKVRFRNKPQPMSPVNMLWCDTLKLFQRITNNQFAKITWSTGDTGFVLAIKDTGILWVKANTECGTEQANFRVARGFSPVVKLGADTLVCDQSQFTILPVQTQFAGDLIWNTGAKSTSIVVSNLGKFILNSTNSCGTASDSIFVDFLKSPILTMPPNKQFCGSVNAPVVLTAKASGGAANYLWKHGPTGLSTAINSPGMYILNAENRCGSIYDSCTVQVFPLPNPNLGIDTAFCGQFNYVLSAGNNWASVIWSNGQRSNTIFANNYGSYSVTVTDLNGCSGSDDISISSNCKLIWYMPDAFTPNADGKNDLFLPVMKDVQDLNIAIYDRWGAKVFEGNDSHPGWNGMINGQYAPDGVYTWMASFRSNFKPHYKRGVVTLIR